MSQLFTSGGQYIKVSTSAWILPMNIQDWFPLGLTGWISLKSKGLSRVFSNTTVEKHQFFGAQLSLGSKLSHPYMTTGKTIALIRRTFVGKVMSLLFNRLSSIFAWKIPWTEEPGRLQSIGYQRVGHDWATELIKYKRHHSKMELMGYKGIFLKW